MGVRRDLSAVDEDTYVFSAYDAHIAFEALPHGIVFFGHTHVPSLFELRATEQGQELDVRLLSGRRQVVDLDPDHRYMINPGSVGQPRDRDPRAASALRLPGDLPRGHGATSDPPGRPAAGAGGSSAVRGMRACSDFRDPMVVL